MDPLIIDVRENDEYAAEHIQGSVHIPLGRFKECAEPLIRQIPERHVLLMCRSGKRAKLALEHAEARGLKNISVFAGGILEWRASGQPTIASIAEHLPLMRQVQIAAGGLIVASVTLAMWIHPYFIAIAAFVGLGLTVAGVTGFCGMALLLAQMPWNRVR